ncbi:hypothetical protein KVR01_006129 [Diaporthe batatas]|uniref:uncharacterized protein n=1 Tax=Diaporthe batatas TaxID=748121 RepID=UPI001D051CCB|nr:uncharacterized protein KVR01_006129 [Diaporthe batatas]KAG8164211.1 hypothetical protein KVR01_006129 [Diaporthe batatas]
MSSKAQTASKYAANGDKSLVSSDWPLVQAQDDCNPFPHLPPYQHPKTGLLSKLPHSVVPYAELTRIDRPAGWLGVYFPFLIGLIYAGCISGDDEASDPLALGSLAIRLIPFSMLLRSAACTWNDTVDQDFDRRVARTRHRPVARRAVSTNQRVTYYPQIVLGILCAWPIFFASSAVGISPVRASTIALFGSNLSWSVINDVFYAFQDIADDEKAGVKSMSLKFKDVMPLVASILLLGQVALLACCGYWAGFKLVYYTISVFGVFATMSVYVWKVKLQCPESCGFWFKAQYLLVGSAYLGGLIGQYLSKSGY